MKYLLFIFLVLSGSAVKAQSYAGYGRVDSYVRNLDAPTMDSLARLLVQPFATDEQKARAIYSWIAFHISYNTFILRGSERMGNRYATEVYDTSLQWKSAVEMTALKAFTRRIAVCDGYAKLFKTLCDYAGVKAEIVTGYARGYADSERHFRSNHSWNAVKIDSTWHLVDVTWGSGYVTFGNKYIPNLDDHYFLTKPGIFYEDHIPEDLRWSLIGQWPVFPEMKKTPFRYKSYVKYTISNFFPATGVLDVSRGDTLHFQLQVKDFQKDRKISPDPFIDSADLASSPDITYLRPTEEKNGRVHYTVVVDDPSLAWVTLLYNDDAVLRYRIRPRE
jgi:hypothetical protein